MLYIHLPSWILAVLEFGTIGSVNGWEALGSSYHAQHAQHRHSLSSHRVVNISTRSALPSQCFVLSVRSVDYFWLTLDSGRPTRDLT